MAVSILGAPTVVDTQPDGTSENITTHSVTSGTEMLMVVIQSRSYDAINPPATWNVTWAGTALTVEFNSFAEQTFAGGRIGVWIGTLRTPTTGAQTLAITSTFHRAPLVSLWNLAGIKATGSPLGATAHQRYAASPSTSCNLSVTAQASAADNLAVCAYVISQNTPFSSFSGTGYTDLYTAQFGNFQHGTLRYKLGQTGTISNGVTYSGSTTANIGGATFEILAEPSTTFDDTVSESVTASDTAFLSQPSTANRVDLTFLNGAQRFTWLHVMQPEVINDDNTWVRIGDASGFSFHIRGRIDNGQGSQNVYRAFYKLADGDVTADTNAGSQSTEPLVMALVQDPGNSGQLYLNMVPQTGYRQGQALTGALALSGMLEIGAHAATHPPPAAGIISRILVDSRVWSEPKVTLISRAILNPRATFGIGDEETAAEIAAGDKRSPVAVPQQVALLGAPSLDVVPTVRDTDNAGWSVTAIDQPLNGSSAVISDRLVRYTPVSGFLGTDAFTYSITSTQGKISTSRIEVRVGQPSLVARADAISVVRNSTNFVFDPLANDTYTPPVRITAVSAPSSGTASITADALKIAYTSAANFTGSTSFTYTVQDDYQSRTATVSVTVSDAQFVTANNDQATTPAGTAVTINALANDSASGSMTIESVTVPPNGTATIINAGQAIQYTPRSGFSGTDTFQYVARLVGGTPSAVGTVTVTVQAAQQVTKFWALDWGGTVEPGSRRGWNIGVMAVSGAGLQTVADYLGFTQTVSGGRVFVQTDINFRADTWDKVIGGPVSNGHTNILEPSQAAVHNRSATRHWIRREGSGAAARTRNHWCWMGITTVPFGATEDVIRAVIRGDHDDKYIMWGRRVRYLVDTWGQDYRKFFSRPNYEFNQNTALVIGGTPGGGFFQMPGASTQMWRDFMSRCLGKFNEGYGYAMHHALSPAYESTTVPASFGFIPYRDFLVPETDIACGSYHPIDNRITTPTAARDTVYSTTNNRYTPAIVIAAARATGRPAAFLEHSLGVDNPTFYDGDLSNADLAYQHFGDICNANEDIMAFTGLLSTQMVTENWLANKEPSASAARKQHWVDLCRAYRAGFNRKV